MGTSALVLLARWYVDDGAAVMADDPVCELETDKATLDLGADADGIIRRLVPEGSYIEPNTVVARITPNP